MTVTQTRPVPRPTRAASQRPGHGRYPSMRPSNSGGWDEGLPPVGSAGHRPGAPEFRHSPAGSAVSADTVVVALTAEHARSLHYSIPMLLSLVRRQLANRRHQTRVVVELDLTAVPPMPICAPLLRERQKVKSCYVSRFARLDRRAGDSAAGQLRPDQVANARQPTARNPPTRTSRPAHRTRRWTRRCAGPRPETVGRFPYPEGTP